MLVDGKAIAGYILEAVAREVTALDYVPKLSVITCAPNFETQKYLEMKKQKAGAVGINLNVVELAVDSVTKDVTDCIEQVAKESDGVLVQLPLPSQIDREVVLSAVPVDKDPDGFLYGREEGACLPPVVGAIDEISTKYNLDWASKKVIVLGQGRLVGQPAASYAEKNGAEVTIFTKETFDQSKLKTADIIISGIGQPHFITRELVKDGVIIFDAGASEDGGVLAGDVHPEVAEVASLFTPVPGGIGPITIAYLLRNLLRLVRQYK
ncbi:bifunctional 5,10-methylenetetrahydrofolate dehydrogenase/5,10-methenyltetrahydrofolate cyclohydrolase [Candidatus Nomurabacteria bacterium]|nr:bifunctional 5,10-methylenetetrahydrofolate dehydrogenase/5,10-methenyltetrahydrofolate cyclohydrolase [Candidatus Kaiserbacteria bacterium]MCB9814318.1 bifunctional 5,10-methylenetetrahydrofolate dehydrogenase/5,10-methenyltetrahydrofolate cyclohydrolase [Candidatus Nomurabacteria bacterium]